MSVLDTKGINVWCAAGKGTFGTAEIIRRIRETDLERVVSHRKIIAPQLGAPGIRSQEVKQATGFRIRFGPVEARDIKAYLENNGKITPEMRRVTFSTKARAVLVPMELIQTLIRSWKVVLGILLFFGLMPEGIMFRRVFMEGLPVLAVYLGVVVTGTVLTPILLPWIPFRSFTMKGVVMGLFPVAGVHLLSTSVAVPFSNLFLLGASYLVFPAISGYLTFNFTGCTTFTSPSGVNRELRILIRVYAVLLLAAVVLLICYKLQIWGVL